MARDLPSLNAIRAFEVAARHLNFSRAADELSVTQSAVSRQIKVLEQQLGQALFERAGPRLQLTNAGALYYAKVAEALAELRRGTAELRRARASPTLTVSVLPTFASRWLVPRLTEFESSNPELSLRLQASYRVIDFSEEVDIDAAIRLGPGGWPDLHATRLTALHVFPACSPDVARDLHEPEDLKRHKRLTGLFDEWPRWFGAAGVETRDGEVRYYSDDNIRLQAAISGQGVTLTYALIAQDELDAGRLVRPFDVSVLSANQYHFVCPPDRLAEPKIQAFRAWLREALK